MQFVLKVICVAFLAFFAQQSVSGRNIVKRVAGSDTGAACITNCIGLGDGDYQSCKTCYCYVSCSNGIFTDDRPCPEGLVWNDTASNCDYSSDTCTEPATTVTKVELTTGTTTTIEPGTGVCITSCAGLENGNYQSCNSCNVYASCTEGILTDDRPCPSVLVWDDFKRRCEYVSATCP